MKREIPFDKEFYTTEIEQIRDYYRQQVERKEISPKEFMEKMSELSIIRWIRVK